MDEAGRARHRSHDTACPATHRAGYRAVRSRPAGPQRAGCVERRGDALHPGCAGHAVEIAFGRGMHRPSLEEALIFLAEAGGDTDTNAAVAGALLGAREGEAAIPPRWLEQLGHARGVSALAERLIQAASPKP